MDLTPIWLSVAQSFIGIQETPGAGNTPAILRWAKDINAPSWFDRDSHPWCAVWMNRLMLACQMPMSGRGFDLLRAKSFEQWGQALPVPTLGAVLVFSRSDGAHVGLYVGERADAYRVLGANQGDAVSEVWIAKARCTAIRWPSTVTLPRGAPVLLQADGAPVSDNEA